MLNYRNGGKKMKKQFKLFSIVMFGLCIVASPMLYAEEENRSALDSANEAMAEIAENRDAIVDQIVDTWSADAAGWEDQFDINVGLADDSKLLALQDAVSFDEVIDILEGDTPEVQGDSTRDLVYTPVAPCLIVDTRSGGGGFINSGQTRNYQTYGFLGGQGGAGFCSSPRGEPSAVHVSVAAVDPNGKGNIKVKPYLNPTNQGLTVNYNSIGTNLNNAGTVGVRRNSAFDIAVTSSFAGVHVTIQVLGYYYPGNPNLNEAHFSGYDISNGTVTNTNLPTGTGGSAPQFIYPTDQSPNTTQVSLSSADRVLVMVTTQIYRSGGVGNDVRGTITPCYATVGNSVVETGSGEGGFQGESDFYMQSTGSTDQHSVQSSYLFRTVPTGTYRFGICATRSSSFGLSDSNFVIVAPKVVVIKLRP